MKSEDIYELSLCFEKIASNPTSRLFSKVTNLFKEDYSKKMNVLSKFTDLYHFVNDVEIELTKTSDLKNFSKSYYKWISFLSFFDLNIVDYLSSTGLVSEIEPVKIDKEQSLFDFEPAVKPEKQSDIQAKIKFLIDNVSDKSIINKLKSLNSIYKVKKSTESFNELIDYLNGAYETEGNTLDQLVDSVTLLARNKDFSQSKKPIKDTSFRDNLNKIKILILHVKKEDINKKLNVLFDIYKVNKDNRLYDKIIDILNFYYMGDDDSSEQEFYNLDQLLDILYQQMDAEELAEESGEEMAVEVQKLSPQEEANIEADTLLLLRFIEDEKVVNFIKLLLNQFKSDKTQESYDQLLSFLNFEFEGTPITTPIRDLMSLKQLLSKHGSMQKEAKAPIQRWLNRMKLNFFDDETKSAKKDLADMLNKLSEKMNKYMSNLEKRKTSVKSESNSFNDILLYIVEVNEKFIKLAVAYNSYVRISPDKTDKLIAEGDISKLKKMSDKFMKLNMSNGIVSENYDFQGFM
jgi:hypothetical protein